MIGLHNHKIQPGENFIPQEFSTISTGFSTGSSEKDVDISGINQRYRKISTDLHKSVEISSINITMKNGETMIQSNKSRAAKIRSSFSSVYLWISTWSVPSS